MIVIGIETSCDETSIGLVRNGREILANLIYSQIDEHKAFSGVVPEIASRAHVEKINYLFNKAIKKANIQLQEIDLIGVVNQPGLVGSLMVGVSFAKSLALFLNKPILTVNHLIAHLYANFLMLKVPRFPYIGLIVSGGHTLLLMAKSHYDYKIIGSTLDDAVGEAYDKVAKLLNLGYPGGPVIDKIARKYQGDGIKFNAGMGHNKQNKYNFSYSGIKIGVLYYLKSNPDYDVHQVVKGFQTAAINVLFEKTMLLVKDTGIKQVVIAGGVAANSYLRKLFLDAKGVNVFIPDIKLCTDNGAMVASCAYYKAKLKKFEDLGFDVYSKPRGGGSAYLGAKIEV